MIELLHAKLHNVKITETQKEYDGSITIDKAWLEMSGIKPYEKVLVADVENGARFETYVIEGTEGSGIIAVNGSAANLVEKDHRVIIMAFKSLLEEDVTEHEITKLIFFDNNVLDMINIVYPFCNTDYKEIGVRLYKDKITSYKYVEEARITLRKYALNQKMGKHRQ